MLQPCSACHRHVRAGEACPFCGGRESRAWTATKHVAIRASAAALLLATAGSVAGCYGGPPPREPYVPRDNGSTGAEQDPPPERDDSQYGTVP